MGLFSSEKHETTIVTHAGGNCGFECTCGAYSRSGPSRTEAQSKADAHKEVARRR